MSALFENSSNISSPMATTITTTTMTTNETSSDNYIGFLCMLGSAILFGSNYLPVKQYETGDGMFFQLVQCLGIWIVGFVIHAIRSFPRFYALPMLGGFLWVLGNNNTVPIIKCVGLGMGMLFWNTVGLIVGWGKANERSE
jgi:drug/metabolite transporter (DMT)-like permease